MSTAVTLNASPITDYVGASWAVIEAYAESTLSLAALCKARGMSQAWFFRCLVGDPNLAANWQIARKIRAQTMADAAVDASAETPEDWDVDAFGRYTANTGKIGRDKLRSDVLLKVAGHLDPEGYGARVINDNRDSRVTLTIQSPSDVANRIVKKD